LISCIDTEVSRFLLAGGLNTLFSYLVYLLLLTVTTYPAAYTISFALGIVGGYTLNAFIVFKQPWRINKLLRYPLVYLAQYGANLVLLSLLIDHLDFGAKVAPLINIVLLLPLTFHLSRRIIKPGVKRETIRP
jgi:putative flippase GtrA